MFPYYRKDERTDRERYLEDELERAEEARRQSERAEQEAREQRRREWQEERRYEERQASNWPEALQKQAHLCRREYNAFPEQADDDYFKILAEANEKALEIWRIVAASKKAELDALQEQIAAVWEAVRNETANKLEASNERSEYKQTAQSLRDDTLDSYLDW